jgi:2-isopropylmalate synthase
MRIVEIYDTTLRDGAQAEDVAFSVEDKLRITEKLDELGIPYIEGGWPGANPKDTDYFKEVKKLSLKQSQIAAFGATRKSSNKVSEDAGIRALLAAETGIITLVGKTWDLHAKEALGISLEKNLEIISDSIEYLKSKKKRVFFDAEHFFDGYKANPDYALATLHKAQEVGADCVVLCDTNGGTMPWELREIFSKVTQEIKIPLGIHAHNDAEMAVANSLMAVELGARHVQGTMNGLGERCGNANLCSIIPNLQIKLNLRCLSDEQLARLKEVSGFVYEIANLTPNKRLPYVGDTAFAHKGGIHIHAVRKNPLTYEHIRPDVVGNRQRFLISDYAGKSSVLQKAAEYRIKITENSPQLHKILGSLKELENQGYQFEGAEASFELLMKKATGHYQRFFDLLGYRVIAEKRGAAGPEFTGSEASVMVKVGSNTYHNAALGNGPVNALDNALHKCLYSIYPQLRDVKLLDYKVRVLSAGEGTASRVRVLIEWGDGQRKWGTVGVSENVIEASCQALVDSYEYKLLKELQPNSDNSV